MNDPFYDGMNVVVGTVEAFFFAGEENTVTATPPGTRVPTASVNLRVDGVLVASTTYPGTVSHVISTAGVHNVRWSVDQAAGGSIDVVWAIGCTPSPDSDPLICGGFAATIVGTPGDDLMAGTSGRDVIVGLGGDDRIAGLGGDDFLCGGEGIDRLSGGNGDDILLGGPGADELAGGPGGDTLGRGAGDDRLSGGDGSDICQGDAGTDQLASCES